MLIIHWVLSDFEWVQTYFSISYRKSLVLFATGGFHGTQRFSGSKYLPPHRGLAMVSVKRAVRPYFGTYLQTSMQSLFRFVSFFLLGTSP